MQFIGDPNDTIVAPATPPGISALAVVRLSGPDAIAIANTVFPSKDLSKAPSHTLHFGTLRDPAGGDIIDEVVLSLFLGPNSYTKEDVVEISTHGSSYIVQHVVHTLIQNGARMAQPGEFSKRAFLNGQFDLAQAEAVADLIHSDSEASHRAAISQMRGGFSREIEELRQQLIHFASMIELELDFSEEDVEFANREALVVLVTSIGKVLDPLIESFQLGNVIKNGVPTVIAGKPNAGKSTLLNQLLNEDRAIVSDIAGTTRDVIEDEINLGGIQFRFIDTAGLRDTDDTIEAIGVAKTRKKMDEASLLLYMFDLSDETEASIGAELSKLEQQEVPFLALGNKSDVAPGNVKKSITEHPAGILLSASSGDGIDDLKEAILKKIHLDELKKGDVIVTNIRHYQNLLKARQALDDVLKNIDSGMSNDFLALDIRNALQALSEITGQEIGTEDLLENIFSKFCIGK